MLAVAVLRALVCAATLAGRITHYASWDPPFQRGLGETVHIQLDNINVN